MHIFIKLTDFAIMFFASYSAMYYAIIIREILSRKQSDE